MHWKKSHGIIALYRLALMASETRRRLFRDLSCTFFLTTLTPQGLLVGIINYGSLFLHINVNSNTQRFFPLLLLPVATTLSWPIGVKYPPDPCLAERVVIFFCGVNMLLQRCCRSIQMDSQIRIPFSLCWRSKHVLKSWERSSNL